MLGLRSIFGVRNGDIDGIPQAFDLPPVFDEGGFMANPQSENRRRRPPGDLFPLCERQLLAPHPSPLISRQLFYQS
ncbi:hypothetical protein [Candidatus Protofrankia californiensis]|uniref:hypothetical protein n=1 Tax=Candidatus Protofrankia californiensis TaxID=1839754 RepID=UPI0010410D80|nr:hypothetical protein [Candidatus Protofrankia californiensis]